MLDDMARRSATVWQKPPVRLAAPAVDAPLEPRAAVREGMSRRRLFTLAGAAVGGTALAAGGLWAWSAGRGRGGAPGAGAPPQQPPAPLWQYSCASPGPDGAPLRVGALLVAITGLQTSAVDPATGMDLWAGDVSRPWRLAAGGGDAVYGLRKQDAGDKALAVLVLAEHSRDRPPVVTLPAFDGGEENNQLLCVDGDTVFLYAKSASGGQWFLVGASLKSGKEVWRRPAPAPVSTHRGVVCGKTVKGGGLLLCRQADAGDGLGLSLHDAGTGVERWQTVVPVPGAVPYQLATDDERLYLGADTLQALRLSDGAVAWSFGKGRDLGSKPYGVRRYGIPAVRDGVVYAVEGVRGIVAVDARSGAERWSEQPVKDTMPVGDTAPAVGAGYVYTMDKIGMRAVEIRSHRAVWRYPTTADTLAADPDGTKLYGRERTKIFALPMR
ncbi:PQQ-binding-like beta-propeller repeat protein [Streptomyces sp. ISL-86]|uniref:outer membrane protein assembly factor BamB family protein n=1 Tax=Streptomyces sp. ISL-86 TaxID=2819187 RepID=UPI001BEB7844|nr:PQQ-binding-like beta-propeller repeat protein [Streptomyces sp. ISL-86]MBT2457824.1 PQQ-binding-like beta-propeller repeat protein [Streptomyces sp. ISL-86]